MATTPTKPPATSKAQRIARETTNEGTRLEKIATPKIQRTLFSAVVPQTGVDAELFVIFLNIIGLCGKNISYIW